MEIYKLGGLTNNNYLLVGDYDSKSIMKILNQVKCGDISLVDRDSDIHNTKEVMKCTDLTYKAYKVSEDKKIALISVFSGYRHANYPDDKRIIMTNLKKLHQSSCKFNNRFSVLSEIDKYSSMIDDKDSLRYLHKEFSRSVSILSSRSKDIRPCHCDLVMENMLINDDTDDFRFIDWEYSGFSDTLWDISNMFAELELSVEDIVDGLVEYYGRADITLTKECLAYIVLANYLWYLWGVVMEKLGKSDKSYYSHRLDMARLYNEEIRRRFYNE